MSASGFTVDLEFAGQLERFEGVQGEVVESLDFFSLDAADRSFPVAVLPREIDVAARVLEGHDLQDALARVYDPEGELVLMGRLTEPRWGRRGEPLRFSILEEPWEDGSTFPTPWGVRVSSVNRQALAQVDRLAASPFPASRLFDYALTEDFRGVPVTPPYIAAAGFELYSSRIEGRAGPLIVGAPGFQAGRTWPATPAYWVDTESGQQRLKVADQHVPATAVTVFGTCVDGQVRGKVAGVANIRDNVGRQVAVAEIEPLFAPGPQIKVEAWDETGATYGFSCVLYAYPGATGVPKAVTWDPSGTAEDHRQAMEDAIVAAFDIPTSATLVDTAVPPAMTSGAVWPIRPYVTFALPVGAWIDEIVTYEADTSLYLTFVTTTGLAGPEVPDRFVPDVSASWHCGWHAGGGLPGGAGDVIAYALRQTTLRIDSARLESARRELNRYQLAGYVDEVVGVVPWLTGQLAWLPISWVAGRRGLYAWLYRPAPIPVAVLDTADGFDVTDQPNLTTRDPVRQVQLRYRSRDDSADRSAATSQRTVYAHLARHGITERLQTDLCDSTATAEGAAALRQRALHRRHLVVRGTLDRATWSWLRAGDAVEVRAPAWGVAGVGYVTELADSASARIRVAVTVLQDPALVERASLTPAVIPPPPPFSPLDLPDCLSWWDCLDESQLTFGGSGGTQLVALADKGPAAVHLASFAAPTSGVPMGTHEIAGETVDLPGPLPAVSPRRVLEQGTEFTAGDLTIVALIPLGEVSTDAYYWTYSHGTIPVVRIGLSCSVSPSGRIRLTLGTGVGTSAQAVDQVFTGSAGAAAHALVIATLTGGTDGVSIEVWYDLDTGAGVQHPAAVLASGYLGTEVEYASFGGRRNSTDVWQGDGGRLHTVITYDRALSGPEAEQVRAWAFERLGWTA